MIRKPCCSRFSLHKFVHLCQTQFKNVHLRGPCSLRPCISRHYYSSSSLKKVGSQLTDAMGYVALACTLQSTWLCIFQAILLQITALTWFASKLGGVNYRRLDLDKSCLKNRVVKDHFAPHVLFFVNSNNRLKLFLEEEQRYMYIQIIECSKQFK